MSSGHAVDLARAIGEGWKARWEGASKDACPYGATQMRLRSGWLCGWNERDQVEEAKGAAQC